MRKLAVLALLLSGMGMARLPAQGVITNSEAKKKAQKVENSPPEKSANKVLGVDQSLRPREPVTTEIYADEAFFDSNKYIGTFTGHIKVNDPRFNLQSDKLTIYVSRGKNEGVDKVIAEGNVAVVRDRPDPNGGPPTRSVGRSESATFITASNDVELRGTPRVQQGVNMHVATSPETVMIINESGQLTTHGPSRTEIHQELNESGEKKAQAPPGQ